MKTKVILYINQIFITAAILISLLLMNPMQGSTDVIFSQGPVDHALSRVSDWSNDNQKSDDFTLLQGPMTITKISWWGSYGANPDPSTDDFVFKFFEVDTENPGYPQIWCFGNGTRYARSSSSNDFTKTATTMVSNASGTHDGGVVYAYSAVLDRPIRLEANKRYWLAITNATPSATGIVKPNSKWGWLESGVGNQWYRMGHCPMCADDWSVSNTKNFAFSLETFPIVGLNNKSASDPIISNASNKFLFTVWGKARITGTDKFEIDDGSGKLTSVESPGFTGFADNDYVKATGLLSYSSGGSVLKADAADVVKIR